MTFTDIKIDLSKRLSEKRFIHTLGVVEAAAELALRYGAPVEQAKLAALLHDSGKELPLPIMQALITDQDIRCDAEMFNNGALLHGAAGTVIAATRYGVTDDAVLEAVKVHTTGKENMSLLDKIIFLADYIEKNRDFPGVDALRKAAGEDLNRAVLLGYDTTLRHLLDQGKIIYPLTVLGRNDMIRHIERV